MSLSNAKTCTMAMIRIFALFYLFTVRLPSVACVELSAEFVFDALSRRIDFVIGEVETVKSDIAEIKRDVKRIENRIETIGNNVSDLIQQAGDKNYYEGTSLVISEKLKRQSKALHNMLKTEKTILDHFQNMFHELQSNIKSGFEVSNLSVGNSIEKLEQIVNDHATYTNVSLQDMSLEIQIKVNETENNLAEMSSEIKDNSRHALNKIYEVGESIAEKTQFNIASVISEMTSKLSSEIYKVTTKVQAIERRQDSREYDVNNKISSHDSRISRLAERISEEEDRKVAFSVILTTSDYYGKDERIKFGSVKYSHGGGYDLSTGIFTAPKSGTYFFTFNVESGTTTSAHVHLMVRGSSKISAIAQGGSAVTGGNALVEYLYTGDKVWIETSNTESKYYIYKSRTSFHGVLID